MIQTDATKPTAQEARLMKQLGESLENVRDMIKWDKVIDQGGRTPYDLSPEQEREAKKFANVKEHKRPANYKFTPRPRKENATKANIIAELEKFFTENSVISCENVQVINKERQISFKSGENMYEITLVQKRKPKN